MEKLKKYLSIGVLTALILACWGEFILCFIRSYSELWYTIFVPSLMITALAIAAYLTRIKWLYFISSVAVITGCILLIGFPAYVMYLGLVAGGISLLGECAMLILFIKEKRE